jgi:hypothetical protein
MPIVFCKQCDNMLYMSFRGDDSTQTEQGDLMYHCKHCMFETTAEALRADRNLSAAIQTENYEDDQASYKQYVNPYIKEDPTLPHVTDINCANPECTRPKDATRDVIIIKYDTVNLKFLYHCIHCYAFWKSGGGNGDPAIIQTADATQK